MNSLAFALRPIAWASALLCANLMVIPFAALAESESGKSIAAHEVKASSLNSKRGKACQPAELEKAKFEQEKNQLGNSHADQHARMRTLQCDVERGARKVPAEGYVMPAADTIKDDDDAKKAVIKSKTFISKLRAGASTVLASLTGSSPAVAQVSVDPLIMGRWSAPFVIPVVGVTAVLLHTGNVMFWSYDPVDYHNPNNSKNGVAFIWNPTTRQGRNIAPPENIWCSAQTILSDGRVYVAGGNLGYPDPNAPPGADGWKGLLTNYTFNPLAERWARQPDMRRGRWYPTTTQLADNRVVITSGLDETGSSAINNDVEIFTPDANIDGIGKMTVVGLHNTSATYPLQFLLPSGNVLEAGPNADSSFQFNPATSNWSNLPRMNMDHYYLGNGVSYTDASVVPAKQLIMVGGGYSYNPPVADSPITANEWLDGFNPTAGWKPYPQWNIGRHNANTVLLPDGSMFTVGGNAGLYAYDQPVFQPELYSKPAGNTTGTWSTVAPHAVQAAYHSTAILLPDATVLLSQDDMDYSAQAAFNHKAQVYSPPYLFKGAQPKITIAPAAVRYGQSFTITTDRDGMTSAVLVAPGATTHGNDMHQRVIKLKVAKRINGLTATVPASSALVPPGYYMLFVMDSAGIPSVAKFVRVT